MESSQLYAATLTHYSTEPLTTGRDYDPLLLLLSIAGDVHQNPGPSKHPEQHPSTTGSTPNPRRRLTVFLFITQSASLASHCQQR